MFKVDPIGVQISSIWQIRLVLKQKRQTMLCRYLWHWIRRFSASNFVSFHCRFLNLVFGSENSLMSYRYIVSTVTNRLHPWWDEGASQVPLRTENSEGIYQDPKLQVSQEAVQCRACMQGIQMFFMKSGHFCFFSSLQFHLELALSCQKAF